MFVYTNKTYAQIRDGVIYETAELDDTSTSRTFCYIIQLGAPGLATARNVAMYAVLYSGIELGLVGKQNTQLYNIAT